MLSMTSNFEDLTKGLSTTSDKIRTLGRAGFATAEIARALGIRYQHARNVLKDAGLVASPPPPTPVSRETYSMPAPAPGKLSGWLDVGMDGSITIPAHLLAAAGLTPGEQLHVRMDDDGIVLLSELAALRRAQKIAAPFKRPGVSMVDEFIADKRAEAQREMEEF